MPILLCQVLLDKSVKNSLVRSENSLSEFSSLLLVLLFKVKFVANLMPVNLGKLFNSLILDCVKSSNLYKSCVRLASIETPFFRLLLIDELILDTLNWSALKLYPLDTPHEKRLTFSSFSPSFIFAWNTLLKDRLSFLVLVVGVDPIIELLK